MVDLEGKKIMNENLYEKFASAFDVYFQELIHELPEHPENLYTPSRYFLNLGGKRIRPLLVLIATDCFNGNIKKAMPLAAAVELFHNFSLIHDDIMDKAPLRRGKQTVHEKWNSNIAVLSGDVLFAKAYQQLNKCERTVSSELFDVFSQTAKEVCEGQQYDMDFEKREDVTIELYMDMIRLKTSVLLACSLKMGAISAGASIKEAEMFYTAGIKLGLAFQLTDDYLDVFGESEKVGKQTGGDIISNKKTWLLLKALESAKPDQKEILLTWLSKKEFEPKQKVETVKNIFAELGLGTLLEKEIDLYYHKAFIDLKEACPDQDKAEYFISFIKTLMRRKN
jgi:geranylgeranyl diphosphate synthase type II